MRERSLPYLFAQWKTRPGIEPAMFIYVATDGVNWRVHATANNGDRGEVLLRRYYRDRAKALADVDALLPRAGGPEYWLRIDGDYKPRA